MAQHTPFFEAGTVTDAIDVEVTYQIIGLFSEGLYSSPTKAIEELVSNSFDADARRVDVVLSRDLAHPDASIAVIDNGTGMDAGGLKTHWIVGDSIKRRNRTTASGRQTIGKFGIGKLAAYVLGNRLTHVTRMGRTYLSTTMDFTRIPSTVHLPGGDATKPTRSGRPVRLDLRTLTEAEAKSAVRPWIDRLGTRAADVNLFKPGSSRSWTVAVISELKPMAQELSIARLRWILSTAMPLRDDFALFLNGSRVVSSKFDEEKVGEWTVGKDLVEIPRPAPDDLEADVDPQLPPPDYRHWYVVDKVLGPVTGYVQVFADPIDTGKSAELIGRSNGFFVYVHGRLVNPDDAGFGIDRNTLRHGTFSRFRVVANIDRLDDELRSSRERMREGPRLQRARHLLQGLFNFARSELQAFETTQSTGRRVSQRLTDSPASLSERPILRLILRSFESGRPARHVRLDGTAFSSVAALREHVEARINSGAGIVASVDFADLGPFSPLAVLDGVNGILSINLEHPFVAHFADEFNDTRKNLPLQLFALSEITLEAQLRDTDATDEDIDMVLAERDELLRHLARSSGRRNSITVAQDLLNAAADEKALEEAVVAAFDQLGFQAIPKGGKSNPDGIAEAFLPPSDKGVPGQYRVSLEAKSKEAPGARVKNASVRVSTIRRHRDSNGCQHAIVIGPGFEASDSDTGAVIQEIDDDRVAHRGKTITLMNLEDLARLVRHAPVKRISLVQLRDLFQARTPSEAAAWVADQLAVVPPKAQYRAILETVWSEQQDDESYSVEYASLRTALRLRRQLQVTEQDLRNDCIALERMAPNLFVARQDRVELRIKPDRVLEAIHEYIDRVPEDR